jgi:hypothetical protein
MPYLLALSGNVCIISSCLPLTDLSFKIEMMLNGIKCKLSLESIEGNLIINEDASKCPQAYLLEVQNLQQVMYLPWIQNHEALCQPELSKKAERNVVFQQLSLFCTLHFLQLA